MWKNCLLFIKDPLYIDLLLILLMFSESLFQYVGCSHNNKCSGLPVWQMLNKNVQRLHANLWSTLIQDSSACIHSITLLPEQLTASHATLFWASWSFSKSCFEWLDHTVEQLSRLDKKKNDCNFNSWPTQQMHNSSCHWNLTTHVGTILLICID